MTYEREINLKHFYGQQCSKFNPALDIYLAVLWFVAGCKVKVSLYIYKLIAVSEVLGVWLWYVDVWLFYLKLRTMDQCTSTFITWPLEFAHMQSN